jgi:hypothetical protein
VYRRNLVIDHSCFDIMMGNLARGAEMCPGEVYISFFHTGPVVFLT